MISVIVKEPNKKAEVREIKQSLETLQEIVGGYIEIVYINGLNSKYVCYCNEEGKMLDLEPNFYLIEDKQYSIIPYDLVMGTVVFIKYDEEGRERSLTQEEIDELTNFINKELVWY